MSRRTLIAVGLVVLLCVGGGGPLGAWAWLQRDTRTIEGVRVSAHPLAPTATPEAAIRALADAWLDAQVGVDAGSLFFITTRRELGARVDTRDTVKLVRAVARSGNPLADLRAWWNARHGRIDVGWKVVVDRARLESFAERMQREVDHEPVAARVGRNGRLVRHREPGAELDVRGSVAVLERALRREALVADLPVRVLEAASDPTNVPQPFAATTVLGSYVTRYRRRGEESSRAHNIELAAERLDAATIGPGESFSFNGRVGARTLEQGFEVAHVIFEGELVDGVGGGACQVASTLHAAAFFAGLDVTEHHPHSRPSSYIPMGLDATVVYPGVDLVLRNPYPFSVRVQARAADGRMGVELVGTAELRRVSWARSVLERADFEDRVVPDPTVPAGTELVSQEGIPGYLVRRVRTLETDAGSEDEVRLIRYPPTPRIVRVAPK